VSSKVAYYKAKLAKRKEQAHLRLDGHEVPVSTNTFRIFSETLKPFIEVIEAIK